uniref:RING-type domain-containing protein n=1 Tax=Oryzias melastigma TaxID=30732 RepID=A0A3B3BTF0_ORYME
TPPQERDTQEKRGCHVCSETFKDPVTLKCNHNFCSSCLQEPKSRSSETGKHGMEVCLKHPGEVKLFCKDEQRPVCPVCEFSQHQSHKVVSVEEAVRDLKEELKSDIKSLTDKSDVFRGVEEKFELVIQHFERQQLTAERQIRAEFNKLHQFLREEEESRVSALREEKEQKRKTVGRAMKKIQDQMSSLSESIAAIKAELQKSEEAFLSTYKGVQNRARTQSTLTEPRLLSGALIDVSRNIFIGREKQKRTLQNQNHFSPSHQEQSSLFVSRRDFKSLRGAVL